MLLTDCLVGYSCSGMESHVFLIVAAVVLLNMVSTEAYRCYNCRYVSTLSSPWENASCTEPFYSANATTCEGNFCIAIWMNFTSLPGSKFTRFIFLHSFNLCLSLFRSSAQSPILRSKCVIFCISFICYSGGDLGGDWEDGPSKF